MAARSKKSFMTESSSPRPAPSPGALHDLPATGGERRAAGKAARKRARRGTLGYWAEEERGHDALKTILAQDQIRVPELVPIRHQRMAVSAWNYYRGAAAVMAGDLASQPGSGLVVQLCGDAHILNFGLWATPERNLSFDLRDFDETHPGPFEWDIKRFAASVVVAARENRVRPARAAAAVTAGVEAYRRRMRRYTMMPELDIWYDGMHAGSLISYFEPADRGRVSIHIEKKRKRRTSRGAFARLTTMTHGRPRITEDPPIRVTITDDEQADLAGHLLAGYRLTLQEDRRSLFDRFTGVDVVRQVVGVGSVGMQVYLVLLEGRTALASTPIRTSGTTLSLSAPSPPAPSRACQAETRQASRGPASRTSPPGQLPSHSEHADLEHRRSRATIRRQLTESGGIVRWQVLSAVQPGLPQGYVGQVAGRGYSCAVQSTTRHRVPGWREPLLGFIPSPYGTATARP